MSSARAVVTIDTDEIRVTTWTFEDTEESTGLHRHEYDYIVVPVTGGSLKVTTPDGSVHNMTQVAGVPYRGAKGTVHTVTAVHSDQLCFVEVELKTFNL